jgi:HEAT repeat protein
MRAKDKTMNWLNKLLNVRPGEWLRLLFISVILILSNIGTVWGMNVAYAAFLKQAGLRSGQETLMWVLLLSSVVSILSLSFYTAFVDRIDNNRLFTYIIIIGGVIKLLSITLAEMNLSVWAFPILYVLSLAWLASWNAHFFTYINDLFDIQSAKRTLPMILATGRIGGALAGFTLTFFTQTIHLSDKTFVWIWFLTDVLVVGLLVAKPYILKDQKKIFKEGARSTATNLGQKQGPPSYIQSMKEGLTYTLQSNFLRWMAVGTLLLATLVTVLEYHANSIMAPKFEDYAGFLGKLDGISNLIALAILLFMLSRMTKSWGIGNTSLVFPILSLLICGGLVGSGTVVMASLAYLDRKGLRNSLQSPIESLLYNAIPLRIKGRARTFVGGLLAPAGVLIGVVLLAFDLKYGASVSWLVSGSIAVLSLLYLVSAFVIRNQYTQALVKMLEEEDYSFLLSEEASEVIVADAATLQRLQKKLEESATHEMRVFMTQLIAQVGGAESLSVLIPAIKSAGESRTRAAMLNVVAAAGLRGDKLQELYVELLADSDAQVRQSAASGLEQLLGAKDAWLKNQWLNMINDFDPHVSLYALQSLAGTGEFHQFESATQKLEQLLKSDSVEDKKGAISVLGTVAQPDDIEQLLLFLEDTNDQIRLAAILDLEKLALPFGNSLDSKILEKTRLLLHDPVARVRQAALKVIGKFKNKEAYPLLIFALADRNSQVRVEAVDILIGIGRDVAPMVQASFNSADPQTRKMAAVVLSRVNPRQFSSLIEKAISDNLNNIYQNIGLEHALTSHNQHLSIRTLLAALRENSNELIDEILYLFSAIHDPQTLKVIGESLHSDSQETRNLALEALESLTSPQTAALIASLFEPSMAPAQLLLLGQGSLNIEQPDLIEGLEKLLTQTEDRLLVLLALYALGDVGATLPMPQDAAAKPGQVDAVADTELTLNLPQRLASLLAKAMNDSDDLVRQSAQLTFEKIAANKTGSQTAGDAPKEQPEAKSLTVVERIMALKEVPLFHNIPIGQLENLAMVCEEKKYKKGAYIFKTGDAGGILYIVVSGQVRIEREKRGESTLLATLGDKSYFGEMSLFDNSPRSTAAVVMQDSLILELYRAPIFTLMMQSPDLALELINVLSQRIRETSDRLADTARSRPRELHKLFDQFG